MKTIHIIPFLGAFVCTLLLAGCSKSTNHTALSANQVPGAVNQAFGNASGEVKDEATNYVAALQNQDAAAALAQLQRLRAQEGLTQQQREVVARAMQTTIQQVQVAAQNGNPAAQSALHHYLSTR